MAGRLIRAALAAATIAVLPGQALAHEGHTHYVMGTIKTIDASHLVVTTTDAKTHQDKVVQIALDASTKYRRGTSAMDRSALRTGERVVVNVGAGKEPLKAAEVRVGGK